MTVCFIHDIHLQKDVNILGIFKDNDIISKHVGLELRFMVLERCKASNIFICKAAYSVPDMSNWHPASSLLFIKVW